MSNHKATVDADRTLLENDLGPLSNDQLEALKALHASDSDAKSPLDALDRAEAYARKLAAERVEIPQYALRLDRVGSATYPASECSSFDQACAILRPLFAHEPAEVFLVIFLNGANIPMGVHTAARGGLQGLRAHVERHLSRCHPRERLSGHPGA